MITVIDVLRDMAIEPYPDLSWSVGARVRDLWEREHGSLPMKALRRKTNDAPGSHCFAIYPDEMRPIIQQIIRAHTTESSRQLRLF